MGDSSLRVRENEKDMMENYMLSMHMKVVCETGMNTSLDSIGRQLGK